MNISIEVTGDLLEYLDKKVERGFYKSRSEIVREAIRQMIQIDIVKQLEEKGLTLKEFKKARKKISGELLAKKYKGKI